MPETRILKSNAHQKLATANPGINLSAIMTKNALMTNKNNPRVTTVIGNVRRTSRGRTNALRSPITTAITNAVQMDSTCTPLRMYATIKMIRDVTIQFVKSFISSISSQTYSVVNHKYLLAMCKCNPPHTLDAISF